MLCAEIMGRLETHDLPSVFSLLDQIPPLQAINCLMKAFYNQDSLERWYAISAFGRAVALLAKSDMERARVVMRRLMWTLNDESGGIGWGAPEAMGEALANCQQLADEYSRILLSYIREDGNYLEYLPLRRGALWGLMRLAQAWPDLMRKIEAEKWLIEYLSDQDPESKGLAILALGFSSSLNARRILQEIEIDEEAVFTVYLNGSLKRFSLQDAINMALKSLNSISGS